MKIDSDMDPDGLGDALLETSTLRGKRKGWDLWPIVAGAGFMVCVLWTRTSGFRRMPFQLQVVEAYHRGFRPAVGYELNPWLLHLSNIRAWRAGCYGKVCFRREDLWKADLSDCNNVTMFLAPGLVPLLERKLLAELPEDARIIAARFPFLKWTPTGVTGDGLETVWAYDIRAVRQAQQGPAGREKCVQ